MSVASGSGSSSLGGYENNNEINRGKMKKKAQRTGSGSGGRTRHANSGGRGHSHLNSLWSVWYGLFATLLQAYAAVKCARRFLQYAVLPWSDSSPPILEFHASLLLTGIALLLLPLFLVSAVFKVGNYANDSIKLGRGLSTCSREPASSLLGAGSSGGSGGCSSLWKHGGPTAPFLHLVTALCLLLPKLLMEARLIEAGFLPQETIWRTDLDFMVVHRDRLIVLSFMTGPTLNNSSTLPVAGTAMPLVTSSLPSLFNITVTSTTLVAPQHMPLVNESSPINNNKKSLHFGIMKTLRDLLGSDNTNSTPDAGWGSSVSVEYLNYALALLVYSVRYPAVFWNTNKYFGALFSLQLLMNSLQNLLAYAGMSILYKVQLIGAWKSLPLLRHHPEGVSLFGGMSPFLLNPHVTLAMFLLSGLLVLCSSLVLYLYGYGRFNAFLNRERERKVIALHGRNSSGWGYVTHCAALCVLLAVAVCNAPLLHDYTVVYRGSLDGAILVCIIGGILHLFLWIVLWLFLTIKQKWVFKLRITIGRATVRSARSVKLVTDVDLITSSHIGGDEGSCHQPLLVVGNGRTYTIQDNSPKKAIMSVVQKAALDRKARSGQGDADDIEGEEQIYWLRPIVASPARSPDSGSEKGANWFNRRIGGGKHKVTFNDVPSTSSSRNKSRLSKTKSREDEDDGDYATLRELPLVPALTDQADDSASEEGKLLACMQDESVTYASTSRDLVPPVDYEDPSPLLTPEPLSESLSERPIIAVTGDDNDDHSHPTSTATGASVQINITHQSSSQTSGTGSTPRCLRRADSGMPHDELTPRSDSVSLESSASPPEVAGSNYSESSSGVHSNASSERPGLVQQIACTNNNNDNNNSQHGNYKACTTGSVIDVQEDETNTQWHQSLHKTAVSNTPPILVSNPQLLINSKHQPIYGLLNMQSPHCVSSNPSINSDTSQNGDPAGAVVHLDPTTESTVVIRRKQSRPNLSDVDSSAIIKDEPFGRSTNMRMTSFTEHSDLLRNVQASSATLPHYPTQPTPTSTAYPHCSTMPLPQHTSTNNIPQIQHLGTSCNAFPRHHTTIPTQLNGVRLFAGTPNPYVKRFPSYIHQNDVHARLNCAESIYGTSDSTATRTSEEIYHYNS